MVLRYYAPRICVVNESLKRPLLPARRPLSTKPFSRPDRVSLNTPAVQPDWFEGQASNIAFRMQLFCLQLEASCLQLGAGLLPDLRAYQG